MYKVAILGYRHQAKFHHAPAFAKNPDCEIVAVCDVVEERAREGAETYGVPAYLDADEMLEKEEIDIVDIPVGEQYRFDLVMKCLAKSPVDRVQTAHEVRETLEIVREEEAQRLAQGDSLFEQGASLLEKGEWRDAASFFRKVIASTPDHTDASRLLKEAETQIRQQEAERQKKAQALYDEGIAPFYEICDFLANIDWPEGLQLKPLKENILLHLPCSQRNVLGKADAVTQLLSRIPELQLEPLAENHLCCGSAGSYQLAQPDNASTLLNRKLDLIDEGAETIVSNNLGCALHLKSGLEQCGRRVEVIHPLLLLQRALP